MFGQTQKTVVYGHMFCALWPFQGGLSQHVNLVDLSLPSINLTQYQESILFVY